MKNNYLLFISNLFESLAIATVSILAGAIATATAQGSMPSTGGSIYIEGNIDIKRQNPSFDLSDSILNGLFTPTAADLFFEAGREDFDREVEIFIDSERYQSQDLLQISPEVEKQREQRNRRRSIL